MMKNEKQSNKNNANNDDIELVEQNTSQGDITTPSTSSSSSSSSNDNNVNVQSNYISMKRKQSLISTNFSR